jgi:NAD(P)-dependent dehydrogenase (short-subunit alcohol dehydrogenase family)
VVAARELQPDAVVVTGAGRGIGRAVAIALGVRGLPTLCIARTSSAEATMDTIRCGGGIAEALTLDLADHRTAERAVSLWVGERPYRRLGVVLAAAELGPRGPLEESGLDAWAHAFEVNVLGNLAVVRALLGRMLETGAGRVVFLAGGGAAYAYPVFPAYACTKAALVRAAENLHEDLLTRGDFAVVCLAPGAVETDMLRQVRAARADVRTTAPADDAVRFVEAFLSSPATALSGRLVHVRDAWSRAMDGADGLPADRWKLRRAE